MLFCAAEFKRSWLKTPGRAVVSVSSATLASQYPSAIRQTAIEPVSWILFANTLPSRSHMVWHYAFLSACCPSPIGGMGPPYTVRQRQSRWPYSVRNAAEIRMTKKVAQVVVETLQSAGVKHC